MSRTALIHVGAHKTGSTSLQTLFTRHRAELRQRGILYPVTGVRPNPDEIDSHTNVAWELRGHTHFNPATGTLDQVIEEIETSECPKVLLSSEEFACLFDQPDELGRLKKSLEGAGLAPHVCLVLRDPTEVAESLYITLAGYGLDLSFAEYFQIVTEEGRFSTPDNTYCFDNTVLARSFVDVFGEDAVTCVEYDPSRRCSARARRPRLVLPRCPGRFGTRHSVQHHGQPGRRAPVHDPVRGVEDCRARTRARARPRGLPIVTGTIDPVRRAPSSPCRAPDPCHTSAAATAVTRISLVLDTRRPTRPIPLGPSSVTPRTKGGRIVVLAANVVPWLLVVLAGAYGVLLRVWLLAHMSLFGDEAVVGLMGRGILAGHLDAFYWGQHYGGVEPYVVAAVLGTINGGPMGLNATPAVLAAVATVVVYFVLHTGHANRRLAAMGAALVWVWPYAAVWNSVREIGFRGVTLCCGLVLVLCALRVHQRRAGPATRVVLGLAAGVGWWASPEIAYFVIPAIVLLVASWNRLSAPPPGSAGRWSAPWHVTPLALTAVGVVVGALPWLSSNVRSGFASLHLGTPAPAQFGYRARVSIFFHDVLPTQLGLRTVPGGAWLGGRTVGHTLFVLILVVVGAMLLRAAWMARLGRAAAPLLAAAVAAVAFPFVYCVLPHVVVLGRCPLRRLPTTTPRAARRLVAPRRRPPRRSRRQPTPDGVRRPGTPRSRWPVSGWPPASARPWRWPTSPPASRRTPGPSSPDGQIRTPRPGRSSGPWPRIISTPPTVTIGWPTTWTSWPPTR